MRQVRATRTPDHQRYSPLHVDRKAELGRRFAEEPEKGDGSRSASLDGIYETVSSAERSSDNLTRQRIRLVGDLREEYFEENGDLIIERELFSG